MTATATPEQAPAAFVNDPKNIVDSQPAWFRIISRAASKFTWLVLLILLGAYAALLLATQNPAIVVLGTIGAVFALYVVLELL